MEQKFKKLKHNVTVEAIAVDPETIEQIAEILGLEEMSLDELQRTRNAFVRWSEDNLNWDSMVEFNLMSGVTAVIDHYKIVEQFERNNTK